MVGRQLARVPVIITSFLKMLHFDPHFLVCMCVYVCMCVHMIVCVCVCVCVCGFQESSPVISFFIMSSKHKGSRSILMFVVRMSYMIWSKHHAIPNPKLARLAVRIGMYVCVYVSMSSNWCCMR